MLARMAWRNVWRNRRRSLIAIAALTLGTAALVFTHSFAETTYRKMIELATSGLVGHVQIHGKGYQADPDIYTLVKDPAAVRQVVEATLPGAAVLFRVVGYGLAAAGDRSTGVVVIGVDPVAEAAHSTVLLIAEGRTLSEAPKREAVVGDALARRLRLKPGGELVLLGQGADGSLANDLYTVVGISTGGGTTEAGGNAVFLHLADAQSFFVLGQGVHQVVVNLPEGAQPKAAAAKLRAVLEPHALEALAWNEMLPEVELGIEADRQGTFAMDALVFLLVVLGMLNAMTMATYERMHELGVLASLGTRPRGVLAMVVLESLFLGVMSLVAGVALAAAVLAVLPPIDLGAVYGDAGFGGVALPSTLRIRLAPLAVMMPLVTVGVTCFFGGLFPAWRAARLQPVDAMRYRA